MSSPFDPPLGPNPAIALKDPGLQPFQTDGPLHKLQFVVELVGPRTTPAPAANALLDPRWFAALGQPQIFIMSPSDQSWRPMKGDPAGSYDSIALAWDLISPKGSLTGSAAQHLLNVAEQFGPSIERRAMPMPMPPEVDVRVPRLKEVSDNLDVGFAIAAVSPSGEMLEKDIWIACSELGLSMDPQGHFVWLPTNAAAPMLQIQPLGEADRFSLGAVQRGDSHEGINIGFSIPRSAAPEKSLEACLLIAENFRSRFGALVVDDEGNSVTPASGERFRKDVQYAIQLFQQADIRPGSPEALKLFGP